MASSKILMRLESKALAAEELLANLKKEVTALRQTCSARNCHDQARNLQAENKKLAQEIEQCKQKLIQAEIANGKTQFALPGQEEKASVISVTAEISRDNNVKPVQSIKCEETSAQSTSLAETGVTKQTSKKKPTKKTQQPQKLEKADDDVTRLDFRVGLIVSADRHPDADSLYVEKVDVGGEQMLTVVSGLAGKVPLEQMQNRKVVLLCNLKSAKMRGIVSQAMVMCASSPDGTIEVLNPPADSIPGDRVTLEGSESVDKTPDSQLKSKVWEAVAAKLRTRDDCVAGYDGKALVVAGKGVVKTESLVGVPIK